MTYGERFSKDRRQEDIRPLIERRIGAERRVPEWIRRMQEGKLPDKDYSDQIRTAA